MKIILSNGIEKDVILATGTQIYAQGANRDSLTFVFANISMDEIDNDFTEDNCECITLRDDEGNEFLHKGYTIRVELVKKDVVLEPEDASHPEVLERRIFITLAQKTYVESQMMSLTKNVNSLMLEVFGKTNIENNIEKEII